MSAKHPARPFAKFSTASASRRGATPRACALITRNGNDFTKRFLLVMASVMALPVRSCLIDGEVIVSDDSRLAVFELIRSWRHDHAAVRVLSFRCDNSRPESAKIV